MKYIISGGTVLLLLIAAAFIVPITAWNKDVHTVTCTVTAKDRTSGKDGDMRVYTKQCGTVQIEDSFIQHRFNSADLYAQIMSGRTYRFTTVGWRNGFFSAFPNIVSVDGRYPA